MLIPNTTGTIISTSGQGIRDVRLRIFLCVPRVLELAEARMGGIESILEVGDCLLSNLTTTKISFGRSTKGLIQCVLHDARLSEFLLLQSNLGVGREQLLFES